MVGTDLFIFTSKRVIETLSSYFYETYKINPRYFIFLYFWKIISNADRVRKLKD